MTRSHQALIACLAMLAMAGPVHAKDAPPMTLSSPAFKDMEALPLRFTQTGAGPSGMLPAGMTSAAVSPPLAWSNPPPGTKAFVLLLTDHADIMMWAVVNIPGDVRALPEAIPNGNRSARLPVSAFHKSFRSNGWLGPGAGRTPQGRRTYYWKLYPLDRPLALNEDAAYDEIMAAMEGHLTGDKAVMITPCCDGSK
jgi:Raf kinase inhibitor-like YbhB/YbcL family protein